MRKELNDVITNTADIIVTSVGVAKEVIAIAGLYVDDVLMDELKEKAQNMNKEQLKSYLNRRRLSEFYDELEGYCKE